MRTQDWQRGILIGVLLFAMFWLGSLIWSLAGKAQIAISQASEVKGQYAALEARKASIEANIADLETLRGKDAAIRMAFGVARPGEEVIVVVPPVIQVPTATPTWWQKVLGWF